MSKIFKSWVLNPDDPGIDMTDLIQYLASNNLDKNVVETSLYNGLVKYELNAKLSRKQDEDLTRIIGEINYEILSIPLDITPFLEEISSVVEGAKTIIQALTEKMLKIDISYVSQVRYGNIIMLSPMTSYNVPVFMNSSYSGRMNICDMSVLGGYTVLSDDPLVKYVLEEMYQSEYVPEDFNVIYVEGLALIPVGKEDYIDMVDSSLRSKRLQGYFTHNIDVHNFGDLELVPEIAKLWNIKVVSDKDLSTLVLQSDVDFGISASEWLSNAVSSIKYNSLPRITISGSWQYEFQDDYNRLYGRQWHTSIIQYGAFLAYAELSQEDLMIRPFTTMTQVNPDLSISLTLPTYQHVLKFTDIFKRILAGSTGNSNQIWTVEACSSLEEGIAKRWMVQEIDNKAMPMLLRDQEQNVLIFRSPLSISYPSPFDISAGDLDEIKVDTEWLKIDDVKNGDYSNDIVSAAWLNESGWRGLFDVSNREITLHGLYPTVPLKEIIEHQGNVKFHRLPLQGNPKILLKNLYEIDVHFDDERVSPLFRISSDGSPDQIQSLVNELWQRGYLASYWSDAMQKYGHVKSYSTFIHDPYLIRAEDSLIDGKIALEHLQLLLRRSE